MKLSADLRCLPSEEDVGLDWLYRDTKRGVWRRVEILAAAGPRPQRVRIQHLDSDAAGRAEWVPSGRLHTPWERSDEYLRSLQTEERLASYNPGAAATDLAQVVMAAYIPRPVADMDDTSELGVLRIRDPSALSCITSLALEGTFQHEDAFCDGSTWFVPWPSAERIIVAAIRRSPEAAMRLLGERTRQRQEFDSLVELEGQRWWMNLNETSPFARQMRRWHRRELEQLTLLGRWISSEAPSLAESYLELLSMYGELSAAARAAVPRVRMGRSQVSDRIADRVEAALNRRAPLVGMPIASSLDDPHEAPYSRT